ncbi:MAG: type II toxin-antitoxin system Phd/YefM family antitoxin [Caldilineaceae bacterium]|nr:type II toxin-antitoxin system Phd/YefM family antitoxin [Caldilineaceae bacterium]
MTWQLQEAKSKFSQVVNRALEEGPQVVTRHGREVVVVLSAAEYRKLIAAQPSLLDLLRDSPLVGADLEMTRDREDYGREAAL